MGKGGNEKGKNNVVLRKIDADDGVFVGENSRPNFQHLTAKIYQLSTLIAIIQYYMTKQFIFYDTSLISMIEKLHSSDMNIRCCG